MTTRVIVGVGRLSDISAEHSRRRSSDVACDPSPFPHCFVTLFDLHLLGTAGPRSLLSLGLRQLNDQVADLSHHEINVLQTFQGWMLCISRSICSSPVDKLIWIIAEMNNWLIVLVIFQCKLLTMSITSLAKEINSLGLCTEY